MNGYYQTSNLLQNNTVSSDSTTSLIGSIKAGKLKSSQTSSATKTGLTISSQAKGISDLNKILKGKGDKNALAGFNETITALASGTSGNTDLNNLIGFGKDAVAKGKITTLTTMFADMKKLKGQNNATLGLSIVKQAEKNVCGQRHQPCDNLR